MGEHLVVVYLKRDVKEFTITARRETGAKLDEVDRQMKQEGFTRVQYGQFLESEWADTLKGWVKADYESKGWVDVHREAI